MYDHSGAEMNVIKLVCHIIQAEVRYKNVFKRFLRCFNDVLLPPMYF